VTAAVTDASANGRPLVVDIHAHHFPVGLPDMFERTGDARWPTLDVTESRLMRGTDVFRSVRSACFDLGARITDLDAAGVDRQVISPVPVTLVDWAAPRDALTFLRAQNDALQQLAAESGGRLVALGAVPLQDTDLAIVEMQRVMRAGMVGLEITAMAAGRELDDPTLDAFWAAAAADRVPIFIHPAHQDVAIRRSGQPIEFGLGMLTDTAIAATALVYGGVLDRHPDLRIALAHGCGTFGWAHPRLRYMAGRAEGRSSALDDLVRSLWVDSLVFDPALFGVLVERFGADHVMFGSDHPFLPEGLAGQLEILQAGCEAHALPDGVFGANALGFLGMAAS